MDILPVIARWLDQHSSHDQSGMSRADLLAWVGREFPRLDAELVADCLCVVGIGNPDEQRATVICQCSRT